MVVGYPGWWCMGTGADLVGSPVVWVRVPGFGCVLAKSLVLAVF